jgi:3-methyladenine DNA glycosylase AlkD
MLVKLKSDLQKLANPEKAKPLQRFFKTGPGQYGQGDILLGINVPNQRKVAKKYLDLSLADCQKLLNSKFHEYRLIGLLIMVAKFKSANPSGKKEIFNLYLKNTPRINNWDLVDLSAPNIVGSYLLDRHRKVLYRLSKSKNLWRRRIAVLSTFEFIKNNQFEDAIKIAESLLDDKHDLIHKAVGWMLREVGKHDQKLLEKFLTQHAHQMPRTMLRYSIEKFPEKKRKLYLNK